MKTAIFLLLSFLVAVSIAQKSPDPVLDIDGKELRTGVNYKILPVVRGRGGGVNARSIRNETCPFDVIQENDVLEYGRPVTFTPVNPKKGVIRVSTDLYIKFMDLVTICIQSPVWRVDNYKGEYVISTNGEEGRPGCESLSSWFKIEKYGVEFYKLVFCPTICETCRPVCGDIGVSIGGGNRRLVLSQKPFRVMFVKANNFFYSA